MAINANPEDGISLDADMAKASAGAPDPVTDPVGTAEAERRFNSYALVMTGILWAPVWITLGLAGAGGAIEGFRHAIGFVQHQAEIGSFVWQAAIPATSLAMGLLGFAFREIVKWKSFVCLEIGAGLGIAHFGFTDSHNAFGALFAMMAGVVVIIDGLARRHHSQARVEKPHG